MSLDWAQPVFFFEGEDKDELLSKFVAIRAQFETLNDFEVASKVFEGLRDAPARAGAAAVAWGRDPEVMARVQELRRRGFIEATSKDELVQEVLAIARTQVGIAVKDRLEAYKLAASMNGYIEKGTGPVVNVQVNRVMKVVDHGSDGDWEAKAAAQQARLMGHVSTTH